MTTGRGPQDRFPHLPGDGCYLLEDEMTYAARHGCGLGFRGFRLEGSRVEGLPGPGQDLGCISYPSTLAFPIAIETSTTSWLEFNCP